MVHWTEVETGYVVNVTRRGTAALWGFAGILPAYVLLETGRAAAIYVETSISWVPWILYGMGVVTWIGCLLKAAMLWRPISWVEVALKGGLARWGSRGEEPMLCFAEVVRLELAELFGPETGSIYAVLPDLRHVPVLVGWIAPMPRARTVVARLNELLGSEPPLPEREDASSP